MNIQSSKLASKSQIEQKPIAPNHVRISISIVNKGMVKFGKFSTEKFQFNGDLRIGINSTLEAIPIEGFKFDHWEVKSEGISEFSFSTDEVTKTFKPKENLSIKAIFSSEEFS